MARRAPARFVLPSEDLWFDSYDGAAIVRDRGGAEWRLPLDFLALPEVA